MKDRLIELISRKQDCGVTYTTSQMDDRMVYTYETPNSILADYLLANGVIVPPCKVGDTVYELKENGRIVKGIVQSIHQNLVGNEQGRWIVTSWFDDYYANSKEAGFECGTHLYSLFADFGKIVFLTKEEAEKALAERSERE